MKLLIGRETVDARSPAARAAVVAHNEGRQRAGIPDAFNPELIDLAKFDAFVAALPAGNPFGDKPVGVDPRRLRIGTSSPTTPGSFVAPLRLEQVDEYTASLVVVAHAVTECGVARRRAMAAREMTATAERDVAAATARGDSGTEARVRRWAVARVWEENAEAAAACEPGDAGLAADAVAATKATDAAVLLGGSMQ